MQKISDIFQRLLYGDQPVGWSTLGRKEVIKRLNRADFVKYQDSLYRPDNIVVTVAGNITPAKVKTLTKRYLPYSAETLKQKVAKAKPPTNKVRLKLQTKKTEQAHFAIGAEALSGASQDKYALKLLGAILGGSMSSRLWLAVRERQGLGYYVSTGAQMFVDTGYLATYAGVDVKRIKQAIQIVIEEYQRIVDEPVSAEELIKAKALIKGRTVLAFEDSETVANNLGLQELLYNDIENPDAAFKKIDRVTVKDIQRVARQVLGKHKLHLAIIGPYSSEAEFKALL